MLLRSKRCRRGSRCSELPVEIIEVILTRLPIASLLRFRSASKSWLSLLSTSHFSKTYQLMNAKNKNRILFSFAGKFLDDFSVSYFLSTKSIIHRPPINNKNKNKNNNIPNTTIIGSLDGLICLFLQFSDTVKQIVVWNPATRKRKTLPDFRVPFSHLRGDIAFGFYFDHSINNYKVVGIFDDVYSTIVKVYSFSTRRWKRIKLKNADDISLQCVLPSFYAFQPAPFRNGKFYWLYYKGTVTVVTWFDVEKDIFNETMIRMPAEPPRHSCFNEQLALCEPNQIHVLRICVEYTTVWILKEREQAWTRLCIVNHATMDRPDHLLYYYSCRFLVLNSGEIVLCTENKFKIYNPNDGSIRYAEFKTPLPVEACTYVESLISI